MKKKILTIAILICFVGINACDDKNVTPTEMKKTQLQGGETGNQLIGTKWELVGFFDIEKDELTEAEPKDCEECYTLTFDTDSTVNGYGYLNQIKGKYTANFFAKTIKFSIFVPVSYAESLFDEELYCKLMHDINSLSVKEKELILYYNDNKNYLLFNRKN